MHRPHGLLVWAALLSPASALAFTSSPGPAPLSDAVGPPSRAYVDHAGAQRQLSAESLPWQRFRAEHPSWTVRWDEATGTPLWMMGAGLDLGPVDADDDALRASLDLLDEVSALSGVRPRDLRLVANEVRGERRYVVFQRTVAGVPVDGALVQLRFMQGRLTMVGLSSHPGASEVSVTPRVQGDEALKVALRYAGQGARVVDAGRLVILPLDGAEGLGYALAWESVVQTPGPTPHRWHTFVDAATGAPLHRYDDVRYVHAGTITGGHEARTIGDEVIIAPLYDVDVEAGRGRSTTTDRDGRYTLPGRGTEALTTALDGTFVKVKVKTGADPVASFDAGEGAGANFDWGYGGVAPMAATHTYHFTHVVHDRALHITPDLPELQRQMLANVELNSTCNAYYNGFSINFFKAGGGCNNTGRIADVVFHEYGHHYHSSLVVTGRVDGSIGEGSGDYLAATITGDPNIAPGFMTDGSGIRNIDPDRVYPNDLSGEVHADGLIWAGAMWDVRTAFIDALGEEAGIDAADVLFATALMGGPTLSTAWEEVLFADDDDGDLSNGTPHLCLITEAMGRHGLGPGVRATFSHNDSPTLTAGQPTALTVGVRSSYDACLSLDPSTATLAWAKDPAGPFDEVAMLSDGLGDWTAALPARPAGTLVYYTFRIRDTEGRTYSANGDRSFALFQSWVGDLDAIVCEDFEGSDGGYSHRLIAGEAGDGADDWMWGSPRGAAGDPPGAASGSRSWGNDLAPDGYNGEYQALKINALTSAAYDTTGYTGVVLRYRRWLNVEDGSKDQATILVNDAPVWANEATLAGRAFTEDDRWTWHYVPLGGLADDLSEVRLTWELATDDSVQLGGWTLDDVCLLAPR